MTRTNNFITNHKNILIALAMAAGFNSCKQAVEVPAPSNSLVGSTVFADNKTATAVLTGVYNGMHTAPCFTDGTFGISKFMATAADEMRNFFIGVAAGQFYRNDLSSSPGTYFWSQFFKYIYVANTTLEGVEKSATLSEEVKKQLKGEALFIRAFMNFYAVNLYGDIPLVKSTDYAVNNTLRRSPSSQVYASIVEDLLAARGLLKEDYMSADNQPTEEKIRPNKTAATALLARVYLYMKDWSKAEAEATEVIERSDCRLMDDMNEVFLKNSEEAIWQLASASPVFTNTLDGFYFALKAAPGLTYHTVLSTYLLNAFEAGDNRRVNWVNSYNTGTTTYYYAYKYKNSERSAPVTEHLMILRVGEQYLIRAEARAHLNKGTAVDDLNAIRRRAGLPDYSGPADQASVLNAIQHERQTELFTEWGHRWFDLKRTGKLDALMGGPAGITQAKGGNWTLNDTILPLPLSETLINKNLGQNKGYN